jgi:hypothetical protein
MANLLDELRHKTEGRVSDSRWCIGIFLTYYLRPYYGPGVDSASNEEWKFGSFGLFKSPGLVQGV